MLAYLRSYYLGDLVDSDLLYRRDDACFFFFQEYEHICKLASTGELLEQGSSGYNNTHKNRLQVYNTLQLPSILPRIDSYLFECFTRGFVLRLLHADHR